MEIVIIRNVSVNDIQKIEGELGITLTEEQRVGIWKQYNRVVTDRAEDWEAILKDLINEIKQNESTNQNI